MIALNSLANGSPDIFSNIGCRLSKHLFRYYILAAFAANPSMLKVNTVMKDSAE